MKTRISFLVLVLLLAAAALASAQEILYTGAVTKDMTIRERKSTSAKKLGSVEAGEFVSIIEFGETWTMIEKDGTTGYILSKNVDDLAAAAGYNDAADALYLGVAGKELTIRAKKSKSALRLHTLSEGETVYILELGETWYTVVKQGVRGYVLADPIRELTPAREGIEIPPEYLPAPEFEAVYSAMADVNLSIRKEKDSESRLMGTVYQNEYVDVMDTDGEWAHVKKGDAEGYVRADHLRYYTRRDPDGPYVPGTVWYPYSQNVLWTLLAGALICWCVDWALRKKTPTAFLLTGAAVAAAFCLLELAGTDYRGWGMLLVVLFYGVRRVSCGTVVKRTAQAVDWRCSASALWAACPSNCGRWRHCCPSGSTMAGAAIPTGRCSTAFTPFTPCTF